MSDLGEIRPGSRVITRALLRAGIDFLVHLPDSVLWQVPELMAEQGVASYVCAREDEGVAICTGAYLAGRRPAILMEGSGIGLSGLILARAQLQRTPMLLIASHALALGEPFDYHGATRLAGIGRLPRAGPAVRGRERPADARGDRGAGRRHGARPALDRWRVRARLRYGRGARGGSGMKRADVIDAFVATRDGAAAVTGPARAPACSTSAAMSRPPSTTWSWATPRLRAWGSPWARRTSAWWPSRVTARSSRSYPS